MEVGAVALREVVAHRPSRVHPELPVSPLRGSENQPLPACFDLLRKKRISIHCPRGLALDLNSRSPEWWDS